MKHHSVNEKSAIFLIHHTKNEISTFFFNEFSIFFREITGKFNVTSLELRILYYIDTFRTIARYARYVALSAFLASFLEPLYHHLTLKT